MPRFDIQQSQSVINPAQATTQTFGGDGGLRALGGAISQAGQQLGQVMQSAKRAGDAQKLANAQSSASSRLQQLSFDLENDPDYESHEQKYQDGVKLINEDVAKQLGDKRLSGIFKQDFEPITQKHGFEVQRGVISKQRDQAKADLTNTNQSYSTLAARALDETERDYYLTQGRVAIRTQQQAGVISAVEAERLDQQFTDNIALADVRELVRTDADAAVDELLNPDGQFSGLDENKRQIWVERAISAQEANTKAELANEARFQREIDQEQKVIEEQTAKDGDTMLAQDQLTTDWVLQNEEDLSKSDFRYFLKQLSGEAGGGRTQPIVFADLYERSGGGEDVRTEARQFLVEGRLSQADYTKIVNRVEGEQIEGQIPSWFKRGEQFINTSMGADEALIDVGGRINKANSIDEWRRWSENNPNATDSEAQAEYKDIVNRYTVIDWNNISTTLPQTKFFSGTRQQPDIGTTFNNLKLALDTGQIDQAEFNSQIVLLNRWKKAFDRISPNAGNSRTAN